MTYKHVARQGSFGRQSRYLYLLFPLLLLLLVACNEVDGVANRATMVAPQARDMEPQEQIVTRVVRQTIAITATPVAGDADADPMVLDVGYAGELPNIDPQKTVSPSGLDLVENLFVGLTNFNHATERVEPELAQSWAVSENGRVWTFSLRDDMFWVRPTPPARGSQFWRAQAVRPVVAGDVVFAIQRVCQRKTQTADAFVLFIMEGCEQVYHSPDPTAADIEQIGIRALDDYTLQVRLTKPASYFLTITSMWFFHPVPPEMTLEQDEAWIDQENLLVSGPFIPAMAELSETRLTLHANPIWPLANRNNGNVNIVKVAFLEDAENALKLWQAKSLDVSPIPAEQTAAFVQENPQKVKLITAQTVFYLGFSFDSGIFRDAAVRRAFSAAIDREQLVNELYGGEAGEMRHLAPPGAVASPAIDEVGVGYSPDYARQQLAESEFRRCRLMPPFTLLVSTSDLSLQQAELVRSMWVQELDCEEDQIIIEQTQFGTLLANTRQDAGTARPDMWELGWSSYYPDAHNWLGDLLHCQDSENRQKRPCSQVDDLIQQAARATDLETRRALYREVENRFFGADGLAPVIPLFVSGEFIASQSWLEFQPALFGGEQFDTYQIDANLKRLERSR